MGKKRSNPRPEEIGAVKPPPPPAPPKMTMKDKFCPIHPYRCQCNEHCVCYKMITEQETLWPAMGIQFRHEDNPGLTERKPYCAYLKIFI